MVDEVEFSAFVTVAEPRLRRALVARFGVERGREAVAEGLAYAWSHWDAVGAMDNPAGYVYRVAASRVRRRGPRPGATVTFPSVDPGRLPDVEPRLADALGRLSERQRVAVFLVYGCDWAPAEVAALLGVSVSTVRNHLARGLSRLRSLLEVRVDA